jgi:hypothetical protein
VEEEVMEVRTTMSPNSSWPGLTRPPSARTSVRAIESSFHHEDTKNYESFTKTLVILHDPWCLRGERLNLHRATARKLGGRVKPGHDGN